MGQYVTLLKKTMAESRGRSRLDYLLVLDFEATCDDQIKLRPQEIIEFPVIKVNAATLETESVFHSYVGPTANPVLTPFCTGLTGITQDMVEGKPTLKMVLTQLESWLEENNLLDPSVHFCFVTCGDWYLKTMLPGQCKYFQIERPSYLCSWINIKRVFEAVTGKKATGMPGMLQALGLPLEGRHHSGIDDAKNIAKMLKALIERKPDIQLSTFVSSSNRQ